MKNFLIFKNRFGMTIALIAALSFAFGFVSCEGDTSDDPTYYTVTIASTIANGTVTANKTSAVAGDTVTLTLSASDGYEFGAVTVTDASNATVQTTELTAGAKYAFTMPASNVTVNATFKQTASGGDEETTQYTVTFNTDGGSSVSSQTVESGKTATKPADPAKDGYTFAGWYSGSTAFDFATPITADITLTAHWTATAPADSGDTGGDGGSGTPTDSGDTDGDGGSGTPAEEEPAEEEPAEDATLERIEITQNPTRTAYAEGETVSLDGLVITAFYSDGTEVSVSYAEFPERFSAQHTGDNTLNRFIGNEYVTYTDEHGNFAGENYSITVTEASNWSFTIETLPKKTSYLAGEAFDPTGLSIKLSLNGAELYTLSWSEESAADFSFEGFDSEATGEKTVTVTYKDMTDQNASFAVRVVEPKEATVLIASDGSYTLPDDIDDCTTVTLKAADGVVDVGGFFRATQELYGKTIVYDYETDIANTTFRLLFADIGAFDTGYTTKYDFPDAPQVGYIGVEDYDKVIALIPSVTLRHHPRQFGSGTRPDYVQRAVEFATAIKAVNIDFNNTTNDLLYTYKGGFITNGATVVLLNTDNAVLTGKIFTEQIFDIQLLKILQNSDSLPAINLGIGDMENKNLYGSGIDTLIAHYYDKNKEISMTFPTTTTFNAKSYLNGANMFDDNGYKNNAYSLNTNAAFLMLSQGTSVANVAITGENKTSGINKLTGKMANIYTDVDMSSISQTTGAEYGMMYFANKSPQNGLGDDGSKIVLKKYNETSGNPSAYDLSSLSIDNAKKIKTSSTSITEIYVPGEPSQWSSISNKTLYFNNGTYKGSVVGDYTNASWEAVGNAIFEGSNFTKSRSLLVPRNLGRTKVD